MRPGSICEGALCARHCSRSLHLPAHFMVPALPRGRNGCLSHFTDVETESQRGPTTGSSPLIWPVVEPGLGLGCLVPGPLLSPVSHLPYVLPSDQTSRDPVGLPASSAGGSPARVVLVLPCGPLSPRPGPQHHLRLPCGGDQDGKRRSLPASAPPGFPGRSKRWPEEVREACGAASRVLSSPPALECCHITGEDVFLKLQAGDSLWGRFPVAFSLC